MPGLWKAWKAKDRLPTLPTSPLEISPKTGEIPTFPQLRRRRRMGKWKTKSRFPTFPPPRFLSLPKNETARRAGFALRRRRRFAPPRWSPFTPPWWETFSPPLTLASDWQLHLRTNRIFDGEKHIVEIGIDGAAQIDRPPAERRPINIDVALGQRSVLIDGPGAHTERIA